jgi:peptide/nickel transport system ATP-binding protein
MQELIKIKDLTVRFYTYEGVVKALNQVNLEIGQKETLGLVGETGCGKTMTALSILRLIPPPGKIESGSILFNQGNKDPINLLNISEKAIRKIRGSLISMVFQEPSAALNPVFTIGDQISEVILIHARGEMAQNALASVEVDLAKDGFIHRLFKPARLLQRQLYYQISKRPMAILPRIIGRIILLKGLLWRLGAEATKKAAALLKEVDIPDPERVVQAYPHQLSGGMKQRSVIAMALAHSPKLLLADEPTTALDVTIQAQIIQLLNNLKNDFEASIMYITHDLAVAAEICDRVGVMYAGSLVEIAPVVDLYKNPRHPYTQALMAAVPKPGEEPHAISGTVPDPIDPPPGCRFHPRCPKVTRECREKLPPITQIKDNHFVACYHEGKA